MEIDKFRGVFSSREVDHGTQTPGAAKTRKRYWLVWDDEDGTAAIQPLSPSLEPAGVKRIIPLEDLDEGFQEEPDVVPSFARSGSVPSDDGPAAPLADGENDALRESLSRAVRRQAIDLDAFDYADHAAPEAVPADEDKASASARTLDPAIEEKEREMRAEFGMALMYLRQGDSHKALRIFGQLADAPDVPAAYKHMYTDFGISLRKSRLLDMALRHHQKVVELSGSDENALHNVARIYYELGDLDSAVRFLRRSLELNPDLDASQRFLRFIRKQQRSKVSRYDF